MPSSPARDLLLIADSGPLIALAGVKQLDLLPRLYRRAAAPAAVIEELIAAPEPVAATQVLEQAPWLERLAPRAVAEGLSAVLGRGEAEAIALALEYPEALLLLDDRAARRAAESLGVPVTGTAGVLVRARREQYIESVRSLLVACRRRRANGYYLSDRVVERACREAGEVEE